MQNVLDLLKNNKRFQYIGILSVIVLFCVVLNFTFSAFTQNINKTAANITVGNLSYSTQIDNNSTSNITAQANKTTKKNVFLTSNNNLETKYELTYNVYDSTCTNKVSKPEGLEVEYSSKTLNPVKSTIASTATKLIRLVITNDTDTEYCVKLGVNAGFSHNTLETDTNSNQITEEYPEDDLTVISYINGVKNNAFPTSEDYTPIVECNNGATGSAAWDGTQWLLTVSNFTETDTKCHIDFAKNPGNWLNSDNTTLLGLIKENNPLKHTLTKPAQEINLSTESLLSYTPDDYTSTAGNSYYFRGNVQNNYVVFNNMCWKIVRIDGNGNIKLILQNERGTSCEVSDYNYNYARYDGTNIATAFNDVEEGVYNTASGSGFMYGDSTAQNFADAQANTTASTLLTRLQDWYDRVFTDSNVIETLADVIWCGDKSLNSGVGYGNTYSDYGAYLRLITSKAPSLKCPTSDSINGELGNLSKYTAQSSDGNGLLHREVEGTTKYYPIGLITADEAAFAGGVYNVRNNTYYLYNGDNYWTMSPYFFNTTNQIAYIWSVDSPGYLYFSLVTSTGIGLRPAVSLNYDVEATYDTTSQDAPGTVNNPYEIVIPTP